MRVNRELADKIARKPLVAIDRLLEVAAVRRDRMPQEAGPLIDLLAFAALKAIDSSPIGGSPLKDLLAGDAPRSTRRFAAAILLRLLARCPEAFDDAEFRIDAVRLFDGTIADDLYPSASVAARDFLGDKLAKLRDASSMAETGMDSVLDGLSSLVALEGFRHAFIGRTKQPLIKAIIVPFLPAELLEPVRLTPLFETAISFRDAHYGGMLEAFQLAHEELETYTREATEHGTAYAKSYLVGLADRLIRLVDAKFQESPLSRPAFLNVKPFEKKYPLQEAGLRIDVRLVAIKDGPGPASEVILYLDQYDNVVPLEKTALLGAVDGPQREAIVPCTVVTPGAMAIIGGKVTWQNVDGSEGDNSFELLLEAQGRGVDWGLLEAANPYSLEPVASERALADRRDALRELIARCTATSMGSSVIYGQRRVGKTSLARAVEEHIRHTSGEHFKIVYLESGAFRNPDPLATINDMGRRLCLELRRSDERLSTLDVPIFHGALAPLDEFLLNARDRISDLRVLFILDEFDELGSQLARRGDIGDPMFVTIRTISGRDPFAFILVGGENMEVIRQDHGDRLNKFEYLRLDYFDRSTQWEDYADLVRQPVKGLVEYSEEALHALYEQTAGHPFFSKAICSEVLRGVLQRHDTDVTVREVESAVAATVRRRESNIFQHFWTDGLLDVPERVRAASAIRRQVLVTLARTLRAGKAATPEAIAGEGRGLNLSSEQIQAELDEFVGRQVLLRGETEYRCKVPLFQGWLVEKGVEQIAATFEDRRTVSLIQSEDERARVKPEEIADLLGTWDLYRGQAMTEGAVRRWLNQFEGARAQRLMFKLLGGIRFISAGRIGRRLLDMHRERILQGIHVRVTSQRRRSDILVSHLGGPGKSGAQYARIYAQETHVYIETNVVAPGSISKVLEERGQHIQRLVFVDDLIASGSQTIKNLKGLSGAARDWLMRADAKCFYIVICAFEKGAEAVQESLADLELPIEVVVCEPFLLPADQAFAQSSSLFDDPAELEEARRLAWEKGSVLAKDWPLGWEDSEALLVFAYSVPNNTLPIVWGTNQGWYPLFPR